MTFAPDRAVIRRRDEGIETFTEVTVSPEDDAEIRRVSVTNHSRTIRELELTSYAEVVLAPQGADLAHPAFSNLFIESTAVPEHDAHHLRAGARAATSGRRYLGHVLAGRGRIGEAVEFETDREHFIGRGGTSACPRRSTTTTPLSGATGAVLDPIVESAGPRQGATGRHCEGLVHHRRRRERRRRPRADREVSRSTGLRARLRARQHA